MQTVLHDWVWGVACAGGLCALCMYLCPEGRVKRVLQMASACVMVLTLYAPVMQWDMNGYAEILAVFREQRALLTGQAEDMSERLNRVVIEEEYCEYIWDKATQCGVSLEEVSVRAVWNEGGYWVPHETTYTAREGSVTQAFLEEIEMDLGIPKERQKICETNE